MQVSAQTTSTCRRASLERRVEARQRAQCVASATCRCTHAHAEIFCEFSLTFQHLAIFPLALRSAAIAPLVGPSSARTQAAIFAFFDNFLVFYFSGGGSRSSGGDGSGSESPLVCGRLATVAFAWVRTSDVRRVVPGACVKPYVYRRRVLCIVCRLPGGCSGKSPARKAVPSVCSSSIVRGVSLSL